MGDYRVVVRIKNARILKAMAAAGIESVSELCRRMGCITQQPLIGELINLKQPARSAKGTWRPKVVLMATVLGVEPEDLFTETQQYEGLKKSVAHFDATEDAVKTYIEDQRAAHRRNDPETLTIADETAGGLRNLLLRLSGREERVIRKRFGFDGEPQTLDEIGSELDLSRARIDQIEKKALRKLKRFAEAAGCHVADVTGH